MAKLVHKEQSYTGGGDTSDLIKWSEASKSVKKNLLPITLAELKSLNTTGTWNNNIYTLNGLTYTITTDRGYVSQISVSGTASTETHLQLGAWMKLGDLSYRFNGVSNTTTGIMWISSVSGTYTLNSSVDEVSFTSHTTDDWAIYITYGNGATPSSEVFKPMLRLASIADATYEPYIPDNTELMRYTDNAVLGARNLLENKATSQTISGVTFTKNADETITVNGTATATPVGLEINGNVSLVSGRRYKIYGLPADATNCALKVRVNGVTAVEAVAGGEAEFDYNGGTIIVDLMIRNKPTLTNVTVSPIITLATDTDDTYVPYAMTNRELTGRVNLDYSTNEVKTNQKWIDGKPIYQRTIQSTMPNCSAYGTNVHTYIPLDTSIDTVIKCDAMMLDSNVGGVYAFPVLAQSTAEKLYSGVVRVYNSSASSNANSIRITSADKDWNGNTVWVTIQYTKS